MQQPCRQIFSTSKCALPLIMVLPSARLHKPETRQGASNSPSSSNLNLIQVLLLKHVMKQYQPNSTDRTSFQTIIICFLPGLLQQPPIVDLFVSDFLTLCALNTAIKITFLNYKSKYVVINLHTTFNSSPHQKDKEAS